MNVKNMHQFNLRVREIWIWINEWTVQCMREREKFDIEWTVHLALNEKFKKKKKKNHYPGLEHNVWTVWYEVVNGKIAHVWTCVGKIGMFWVVYVTID